MAVALEGDGPNTNVAIGIVEEMLIKDRKQNGNVIKMRKRDISPHVEVGTPAASHAVDTWMRIETPEPHPPSPPVTFKRTEIQEISESGSPAQSNVQTEPASGSGSKVGGRR